MTLPRWRKFSLNQDNSQCMWIDYGLLKIDAITVWVENHFQQKKKSAFFYLQNKN